MEDQREVLETQRPQSRPQLMTMGLVERHPSSLTFKYKSSGMHARDGGRKDLGAPVACRDKEGGPC